MTTQSPRPAPTDAVPALPPALEALPLTLTVRVGSAALTVAELSALAEGATLTLGARIDDPLEVCIEDRVVARGELMETEQGLAVKLTEIAT